MARPRSTRRRFLHDTAGAAAGLAAAAALGPRLWAAGRDRPPNILYLMTDDQRWDGLSIMGNPVVETPHMDRLAREGALFERMFVTNALCAPSRASFLTGVYSHVNGVRTNASKWEDQPIVIDPLRAAGYHTCFIGKCHQGETVCQPKFDLWLGFNGQGRYFNPTLRDFDGTTKRRQGHMTDLLGDRAVAYLAGHRRDPFCCFVWFKSPHRAWEPAPRHADLYADKTVPRPPTFDTDYAGKPQAVRHTKMQVETAKGKASFDSWVKDYYRTIAGVDEQVGRILKTLDDQGLAENTIVVFTGDNGFFLGEHHFFDKRLMYEPSIRIPMLVRWPARVAAGRRIGEMALNVDLAPTLLDCAGCDVPDRMQGRSWRPLLEGRAVPWRESWYYRYYEYPASHAVRPNRGVRTDRWKYIEYPAHETKGETFPAEFELYDLETDPHEATNLHGRADREASLCREMCRLAAELGDEA